MEERKVPAGYALSEPVIFTVNKAGTGIHSVSNDFHVLKLADENGSIEALTITGRVPVKVYTVLKDLDTGTELPAFTGTGGGKSLTAEDGITDGHLYEITEFTRYSDGREEKSLKKTRRIYLDEDGAYRLQSRTYLEARQELTDKEGNILASWVSSEDNPEYTIMNPVTKEVPIARITSAVGADHSAVKKNSVIKYTVAYNNPYDASADIQVKASLEDGLEYLRSTNNGAESNGIVTWSLTGIAPHESGTVDVVAVAEGETGEQIKASFETKTRELRKYTTLTNPIAPDGSVTVINKLIGTGKNQADAFTYHVRLTDRNGNTLTGYQAFSGSVEGRIKGAGNITLTGDSFLTFAGLPYGTEYEITQESNDEYEAEETAITGEITKTFQSAVFKSNRDDESIREILTAGGGYRITETTAYSDGTSLISGIYRFQLNASGKIDNVDMEDRPIRLYFSKTDRNTGNELADGSYRLIDAETGETIYEFTKEEDVVLIPAELITPGKEYIFREEQPPSGYAWEKEIRFTAEESGAPETIIMQDKKTEVEIRKEDAETGELLTGGSYSIRDKETEDLITRFTAEGKPVLIKGLLIAGKTYELIEEEPPTGYAFSQNVEFTVPQEPEATIITMKDKKTEVSIEKLGEAITKASPSEAAGPLPGSTLQILNEDKTSTKALRNDNDFKAGDDLFFTTGTQLKEIKGQLIAGGSYWLHEVKPADGYAYADDIPFTISLNGDEDVVVMIDDPTHVILSKKAITGEEELPGNHMSVMDKDGKLIEEWVSGEHPHEIIGKLNAGEAYQFHEVTPSPGYAYGQDVAFSVSRDGSVDQVEMRNDETKVRINKVNAAGMQLIGAVLQILDKDNIIVIEFETTGNPFDVTGLLAAGESYYLHEVKAPDGYLPAMDKEFIVPRNTEQLEVTMIDLMRHGTEGMIPPPIPIPAPKPDTFPESDKVGVITASYRIPPLNPAWLELAYGKGKGSRGEKTGDRGFAVFLTLGMVLCLSGFLWTMNNRGKARKDKKEDKKSSKRR